MPRDIIIPTTSFYLMTRPNPAYSEVSLETNLPLNSKDLESECTCKCTIGNTNISSLVSSLVKKTKTPLNPTYGHMRTNQQIFDILLNFKSRSSEL